MQRITEQNNAKTKLFQSIKGVSELKQQNATSSNPLDEFNRIMEEIASSLSKIQLDIEEIDPSSYVIDFKELAPITQTKPELPQTAVTNKENSGQRAEEAHENIENAPGGQENGEYFKTLNSQREKTTLNEKKDIKKEETGNEECTEVDNAEVNSQVVQTNTTTEQTNVENVTKNEITLQSNALSDEADETNSEEFAVEEAANPATLNNLQEEIASPLTENQALRAQESVKSSTKESLVGEGTSNPVNTENSNDIVEQEPAKNAEELQLQALKQQAVINTNISSEKKSLLDTSRLISQAFELVIRQSSNNIQIPNINNDLNNLRIGSQKSLQNSNNNLHAQINSQSEKNSSTKSAEVSRLPRGAAARTLEKVEAALKEVSKAKDGKTISVRLDPPNLGSVKIDVTIRDGHLHARMVTDTNHANLILREHSQEIHGILRKLGLNVDQVSVSVSQNPDETNFLSRNNSHAQERQAEKDEFTEDFKNFGQAVKNENISLKATKSELRDKNINDHWIA